MPSFFRTAEDVRIFFLNQTNTPERKKQRRRLDTVYRQCVRRAGTRGHFFFHRRCATLKGRPFLILEPQGPVDRGIFQEGITRFGETLSGTFHCPRPGYIVLVVNKAVAPANAVKYSRLIRRLIAQLTGMMTSGGDDRVIIYTAEQAARIAKAEAKARQETARRDHATAVRLMEQTPAPDPARAAQRQEHATQAVRRTWLGQVVDFRSADADLQELEAERSTLSAPVSAVEEEAEALRELRYRLVRVEDAAGVQELLAELAGGPHHDGLQEAITDSEDPVSAAQHWLDAQQRRNAAEREAQQPEIDRIRAITAAIQQQRQQMDQTRRKIITDQADAVRKRIRQAQEVLDAARQAGPEADDAAVPDAAAGLAAVQAELALIGRLQRADGSMRWIENSLQRMADAGQTDPEAFARQVKLDFTLRQSVSTLKQDVRALDQQGAGDLLDALWHQRPGIAWARPMMAELLKE